MKIKVRTTASGLVFLLYATFASFAQSATLSSPTRSGDQFQFNLQGDPYRHYVIQSSSNLHDWISLTTNISPLAIRPLSFPSSNSFNFYRSALFIRTNLVSKATQTTASFDLNGYNFSVDSFDSRDPSFSTMGQYDPNPAKTTDHAELSLDQGLTNSLQPFGNALVYGSVSTGPEAPLMLGQYGSIGDITWSTATNYGVECGKLSTDLNPYFPEVKNPFPNGGYSISAPGESVILTNISRNFISQTTSNYPANPTGVVSTNLLFIVSTNAPDPSTVSGSIRTNFPFTPEPDCADNPLYHQTNYIFNRIDGWTETTSVSATNIISSVYDYVLETGNYKLSDLSGKVLVQGNARVYVTDSLRFFGQDSILIKTNASLELYFGGTNARLSGNGIINEGNNPTNFIFYGLPSNTNVDLSGNNSFTGIIYAPQADLFLGGGGNHSYDFIGAIVTHSVILNGQFNFHYDDALRDLALYP